METTPGRKIVLLALVLLFASSCRFKFPSTNEGQLLARQGAFPSGLPGWVKTPPEMGPARVSREGLVPQTYGAAQVVQTASGSSAAAAVGSERDAQLSRQEAARKAQTEAEPEKDQAEVSPLDRIEQVCPGMESQVSDALRIEGLDERIRSYENLTSRCSQSSDLWFWLGRDYQQAKRYPQAVRAFEQVLVLDPRNQAARALLDESRGLANQPQAN